MKKPSRKLAASHPLNLPPLLYPPVSKKSIAAMDKELDRFLKARRKKVLRELRDEHPE